ncbi:nudC domain-containing protein 1 isoform X2 [Pseudophryne corroboree]|uniref:nudC domain-containing protein 1 isoform X2 n=1 Tax=Pseudophryne corroboree TaxID=495146 RepID=UPI0030815B61
MVWSWMLDTTLGKPAEVFRFPSDVSACDRRLCASMHFTSPSWVTLSDGTGTLYLIHIVEPAESVSGKWALKFNQELGDPFIVVHSVLSAEAQVIHVLLLSVEKDELDDDKEGSGFHVALEWVSIACDITQGSTCEIVKRRKLHGKSVPHYAAIELDGKGLMIISYKPFSFVGCELNQPEEEAMDEGEKKGPLYVWQQTAEDVTMTFRLPDGTTKEDVKVQFSPYNLSISLKEQDSFLKGQLYSLIDPESSIWTVKDERSIEVTMDKRDTGCMWTELIVGDKQGEYIADPVQCAAISQQLMHLTSETLNPDPDCEKPACNAQELEECDISLEDSTTLCRFDSNSLKATHVVNLGSNQYLFSLVATPTMMPCFSLRHDVDALLWQPIAAEGDDLCEHAATFNALGYVQASKQDKKFFTCAPDFSYAALCECVRRIFIYRQPTPISTVLYNRKEGRHVGQVAKQQVASLESSDPILGFQASNERLFVLTTKNLFVIRVNTGG